MECVITRKGFAEEESMKVISVERKIMEFYKGFEVGVKMEGSIEEYAKNFLAIFNNVRENDELVSVRNDWGNTVYVTCYADALAETKKFLSQFGRVVSVESALVVRCGDDIEYDFGVYDSIACDFTAL